VDDVLEQCNKSLDCMKVRDFELRDSYIVDCVAWW
jgi:hypothetical protein